MRQWLHWRFVVPRLLAVAVAMLAAQYILGVVARSVAIQAGEAAIGRRVEVGHARVSLSGRQVVLDGLRVTDGRGLQNLFEADRCELKFATGPALHKKAVVESGRISGLRFDELAEAAGELKIGPKVATASAWFKSDAELAARKWLARLNGQFTLDAVKDFDSVTRTEAFCADWSKRTARLASRLQEFDSRAAALQEAIESAEANPLRNDKLLADLRKKV